LKNTLGAGRRELVPLLMASALAVALSFHVRLRAWPETLVPAYLVSRGWVLYRDVKFAHTPLWIGFESLVALLFRLSPASLRVLALGPALAAIVAVQVAGRRLGGSASSRAVALLFFVGTFFLWDANAVYPDVAIAALSVPAFLALRRQDRSGAVAAGLLFGCAAAVKQPAAVAGAAAVLWLALAAPRLLPRFVLAASAPLALCAAVMAALGAGREFFLWTVVVPLRDYRGRTNLAMNAAQGRFVLLGLLPLFLLLALSWRMSRERRRETLLLAVLAAGFGAMAFPKFELVHLAPAVPLLAVAAGAAFDEGRSRSADAGQEGRPGPRRLAAAVPLVVIALDALFLATDTGAGEIVYWTSPANDSLVAALAFRPPAPLYLYGPDQNVFIRSGRVPPGGFYTNPDLWYHFRAENLERRQIDALKSHPETIVVYSPGGASPGEAGGELRRWIGASFDFAEPLGQRGARAGRFSRPGTADRPRK